jgi:hypothetical protein
VKPAAARWPSIAGATSKQGSADRSDRGLEIRHGEVDRAQRAECRPGRLATAHGHFTRHLARQHHVAGKNQPLGPADAGC